RRSLTTSRRAGTEHPNYSSATPATESTHCSFYNHTFRLHTVRTHTFVMFTLYRKLYLLYSTIFVRMIFVWLQFVVTTVEYCISISLLLKCPLNQLLYYRFSV